MVREQGPDTKHTEREKGSLFHEKVLMAVLVRLVVKEVEGSENAQIQDGRTRGK
jgi:hypothetical protein